MKILEPMDISKGEKGEYQRFMKVSTPITELRDYYDVVIVGAGVGGLTAGCFLAKNGLKTLIIEQHYKPGGCCSSFIRNGYCFDAGAHIISGLGNKFGNFNRIFSFLKIDDIEFVELDPIDALNSSEFRYEIPKKIDDFKFKLKKEFGKNESNIDNFFKVSQKVYKYCWMNKLYNLDLQELSRLSYQDFLYRFFDKRDEKLLKILSYLWSFLGTVPRELNAVTMINMLMSYLEDGAYYPVGGSQSFSDNLLKSYFQFGGEILFLGKIDKIDFDYKDKTYISKKYNLKFKYVVSNISPNAFMDTFNSSDQIVSKFPSTKKYKLNISSFNVYLGIDQDGIIDDLEKIVGWHTETLELNDKNVFYVSCPSLKVKTLSPSGKGILIIENIISDIDSYQTKDWFNLKDGLAKSFLEKIIGKFPFLKGKINYVNFATPKKINHYTKNEKGSIYGWDMNVENSFTKSFPQEIISNSIYQVGHWTYPGPGVSSAFLSGYFGARRLLAIY